MIKHNLKNINNDNVGFTGSVVLTKDLNIQDCDLHY